MERRISFHSSSHRHRVGGEESALVDSDQLSVRYQQYKIMKTVLLTGFEAFGNTPVNPAEAVTLALDGTRICDSNIIGRVIPNTFFECIYVVCSAIEEVQPEIVIMMGEYGGRADITVERLAQNFNDSTRYQLKDNRGIAMQGEPTIPEGPVAYRRRSLWIRHSNRLYPRHLCNINPVFSVLGCRF